MNGAAGYAGQTITLLRGESKTLQLTVLDQDRNPVDLTGTTLTMMVKKRACDTVALIEKSSSDPTEIEIQTPATAGIANIKIAASDTANLAPARYVYDIWIQMSTLECLPVIRPGAFEVNWSVTVL